MDDELVFLFDPEDVYNNLELDAVIAISAGLR